MVLFNRMPQEYEAVVVGGVTVISPRNVPDHVRALLSQRHTGSGIARDVVGAMFEISGLVDPGFRDRPVVGAHPSLGEECQRTIAQTATLRGPASVQDLLGTVSLNARGIAWTLEYSLSERSYFKLGFLCGDGSALSWNVRDL